MSSYYVYILKSLKDGELYTGVTSDIHKRLKRHNNGYVSSTKKRRPFEIVYCEEHQTLKKARQRESYLKSLKGSREKSMLVASVAELALDAIHRSVSTGRL